MANNPTSPLFDGDPNSPTGLRIPANSVLLIPTCRVEGGKQTTSRKLREDEEGNKIEVAREVTTLINDVQERKQAEALASAGTYQVRRVAHSTPIGYVTTRDRLPDIDAGLAELRAQVDAFNGCAQFCNVKLGYLPIPLSVDLGPEVAQAMADTIRAGFERALDAIRAGDPRKVQNVLTGIHNSDQLCTGVMRDSVLMALDQVRDAIRTLREDVKRGLSPESAGASYDASMIEAAIGLFSY
jgi:hypothetical protein